MAVTYTRDEDIAMWGHTGSIFTLTGDGSDQYVSLGGGTIRYVWLLSSGTNIGDLVRNSNDGTEATSDGAVYFSGAALGNGAKAYIAVLF